MPATPDGLQTTCEPKGWFNPLPSRRMQALSGLGTSEAHEETIAATLRLKGITDEEARDQAATFSALMFETWEPEQVVS